MFLKKIFQKINAKEQTPVNYLVYAISEIALIIIGILLAVNIDSCVTKKKDNKIRCEYLTELKLMIASDIKDVEDNISSFEIWNPMINDVLRGLEQDTLSRVDSLNEKFGIIGRYIHFQQGSSSLFDELKYSEISLIPDRKLKSEILKYQNETIAFLRDRETRYEKTGDDIRNYYLKNFVGFPPVRVHVLDIEKLKKDKQYFSLVYQKLGWNSWFEEYYKNVVIKQLEKIKSLIDDKINKECN